MRILLAFAMLAVVGVTPAFADVVGCACEKPDGPPPPADMTIPTPRDLSTPPRDLSNRGDARRDRRTRRRAAGAGMIVLSGLGVCGVALARRRGRA